MITVNWGATLALKVSRMMERMVSMTQKRGRDLFSQAVSLSFSDPPPLGTSIDVGRALSRDTQWAGTSPVVVIFLGLG